MASPHDLLLAAVQIGMEDTEAGVGLVALTGRERPIVRWRSEMDHDPPVVAVQAVPAQRWGGVPDKWQVDVTFAAVAPFSGADGLEWTLLERIERRFTHEALSAKGLDAAVDWRSAEPGPEVEQAGDRADARYEVELTR